MFKEGDRVVLAGRRVNFRLWPESYDFEGVGTVVGVSSSNEWASIRWEKDGLAWAYDLRDLLPYSPHSINLTDEVVL